VTLLQRCCKGTLHSHSDEYI